MSQPSRNTGKTSGAAYGRPAQSEMMKGYLAGSSTVVDRLVSGTMVTEQGLRDSLALKAKQLDELVRQSQGRPSGSG